MKERIRELIEESKCLSDGYNTGVVDLEKFAELIVRECARALDDGRLNDVRSAANGCVRIINEHFGVEDV